jgi:imidazolonepropionase
MWDTLWLDGHIATLDPTRGPWGAVRDGALGVAGGRIAWIGPRKELPGRPAALARDVREMAGGWMTPGLIDCHTHMVFAGDRAVEWERRLAGATYEQIAREGGGILETVRRTRAASAEQLSRGGERRAARLAAEGVTTVEVKSGYGLELETELRMLAAARAIARTVPVDVRTTVLAAHAVPPEYAERRSEYVSLVCDEILPRAAAEGAQQVDAVLEGIAFTA